MDKPTNKVKVTGTAEQRSPKSVRRLGRALIALAAAQLEAEAEAQDKNRAKGAPKSGHPVADDTAAGESGHPTGDAA